MRHVHRRYLKSFIPAMLAYVLVLFVSIYFLKQLGPSASVYLRIALSLSPVIPIIFVCRAVVIFVRDSDELQQKIDLQAIALSCLLTSLIFMSLGFLASSNIILLDGAMVAIMVLPSLFGVFGLTKCVTAWRYR